MVYVLCLLALLGADEPSQRAETHAPMNEVPEVFNKALVAHQGGRYRVAEEAYAATISEHPTVSAAYNNLATLLRAEGRWAEAEAILRRGVAALPENADLAFVLAQALLQGGDYRGGWGLYEARRKIGVVPEPRISFPEWTGERIASLVLLPEQGFGDQIQFARYIPLIRANGISVTVACKRALARLFEPFADRLITSDGPFEIPPHDRWALMGTLPLRFRTTLETLPKPLPVNASARRSGGIGIMARGSPGHPNDKNRSLPPALAEELLALPGANSLAPEHTGARDFQDTADLIAGFDLVISVDTAVAHLAGSLGVPTWILLPRTRVDWRWLRDRADSPWYPSARLFRQLQPGDWSSVLLKVREELAIAGLAPLGMR